MPPLAKRLAILTEAGAHADWVARPLRDAGIELTHCAFADVPGLLDTGLYNVLLLGRFYTLRQTKQQEATAVRELAAAVRRFLDAGGGVFFTLPIGGVLKPEVLLDAYGVRILDLAVRQPEHLFYPVAGSTTRCFAYTSEIAGPFRQGVDGVWFPAQMDHAISTRPVHARPEDGWFPILSASAASRTDTKHVGSGNSELIVEQAPPQFDNRVPLIVGRECGRGRMAVCGIASGYHIGAPHGFLLARKLLAEGFEGQPSGLMRLLANVFEWLGEPSLKSGALGGGRTDPSVLTPQVPRYPDPPPVRWVDRAFPPDDPRPLQGLIGARTAYSTGRGTVAEYAAKARRAGLDFVVFLEDFKALDSAKLEALKAGCEQESTGGFFAVPGYTIEDACGTRWFVYGYRIVLPRADLLSADGKVLAPSGPKADNWRSCRPEHVHFSLVFDELKLHCRHGRYRILESPLMLVEHRTSDSIGLVTWEDGRIVEDVRDRYRYLEDHSMRLNPVVLTFMNSPDDLDRAVASGWRNAMIEPYASVPDKVLRKFMAPELEWWGMIDEAEVRHPRFRFDNWQYGPPFQYITSGPAVRAWTASVTNRDPTWRAPDTEIPPVADWFRTDVIGFRLRLKVTSDAGLDDVRLYDGERLIRRWQCNGDRVFERELDLAHHQQMHLGLEARDVRGGTATCLDYPTLRLDWCEFYCADRNNPLMIGFEKDARGLAFGWSGTIYLTYNNAPWGGTSCTNGRWWYGGDNIYPVPSDPVNDDTAPMDGGVGVSGSGLHVMVQMPAVEPREYGLEVFADQKMISTDVSIGDEFVQYGYDRDWPGFFGGDSTGFGLFPAHPTRYVDLRRRATVFRPKPHALTLLIYDYELKWKQDPRLQEPLRIGWLDGEGEHVLYRQDGTSLPMPGMDTGAFSTPWRRGEYLVSRVRGRRPSIFINDGCDLILVRDTTSEPVRLGHTNPQGQRLAFFVPVEGLPSPGRPARWRFLASGGGFDITDPDVAGRMRRGMGLDGEPGYRVEMRRGRILSQRLVMDVEAEAGSAVFRIPRADLPMALPVTVRGINENWPVFLVDLGARRCRPLGVLEGTAYAVMDTSERDWDVLIGHPVSASDPEVSLALVQTADDEWSLEVHNPTGRAISAKIRRSEFFDLIAWDGESMTLQPGSSWVKKIRGRRQEERQS